MSHLVRNVIIHHGARAQISGRAMTGIGSFWIVSFNFFESTWRKAQGDRILFAGKTAQNAFQEVLVPASLEPFAADASF
jgi:hypothetical protein